MSTPEGTFWWSVAGLATAPSSLGLFVLFITPWWLVAIGISATPFIVALCDTVPASIRPTRRRMVTVQHTSGGLRGRRRPAGSTTRPEPSAQVPLQPASVFGHAATHRYQRRERARATSPLKTSTVDEAPT